MSARRLGWKVNSDTQRRLGRSEKGCRGQTSKATTPNKAKRFRRRRGTGIDMSACLNVFESASGVTKRSVAASRFGKRNLGTGRFGSVRSGKGCLVFGSL